MNCFKRYVASARGTLGKYTSINDGSWDVDRCEILKTPLFKS